MGRCRLVTLVAIMVATAVATSVAVTPLPALRPTPDPRSPSAPSPSTWSTDRRRPTHPPRCLALLPSTATAARPAPVVVLTHGFGIDASAPRIT